MEPPPPLIHVVGALAAPGKVVELFAADTAERVPKGKSFRARLLVAGAEETALGLATDAASQSPEVIGPWGLHSLHTFCGRARLRCNGSTWTPNGARRRPACRGYMGAHVVLLGSVNGGQGRQPAESAGGGTKSAEAATPALKRTPRVK